MHEPRASLAARVPCRHPKKSSTMEAIEYNTIQLDKSLEHWMECQHSCPHNGNISIVLASERGRDHVFSLGD